MNDLHCVLEDFKSLCYYYYHKDKYLEEYNKLLVKYDIVDDDIASVVNVCKYDDNFRTSFKMKLLEKLFTRDLNLLSEKERVMIILSLVLISFCELYLKEPTKSQG